MFLCWSLVLSMGSALRSPVVLCVLLSSQQAGNCWSPPIRVVSYSNLNAQVTLVYSISISQTPQKVCRFLKHDVPLSDPTAWEAAASTLDTQRSCSTRCTSQTSVIWRAVSRHSRLFHTIPGCFTEKGQEASLCSASLQGFSCQRGVLSCFSTSAAAEGGALGGRWVAELCSAFTSSPLPPCWEILRRAAVSRGQHFAKEPQWTHVLL